MIIEIAAALFIVLAVERRLERVRWTRDRWAKVWRVLRGQRQ